MIKKSQSLANGILFNNAHFYYKPKIFIHSMLIAINAVSQNLIDLFLILAYIFIRCIPILKSYSLTFNQIITQTASTGQPTLYLLNLFFMKISELNISQDDELSIFDSEDEHHHFNKSITTNKNQFQFNQQQNTKKITKKQQKKPYPQQKEVQTKRNKKQKNNYKESSSDQYQQFQVMGKGNNNKNDQSFQHSSDNFSEENQSRSKGNQPKARRRSNNPNKNVKTKPNYDLIADQQFKILQNGTPNQFNFKYNLAAQQNYIEQPLNNISKHLQNTNNHPYLYTNSKNPYQGVYQADSDAEYFQQDQESPYSYYNPATVSYEKQVQNQKGSSKLNQRGTSQVNERGPLKSNQRESSQLSEQKIKMQQQQSYQYYHLNNDDGQKSSSSLKQFEGSNKLKNNNTQNQNRNLYPKKRGRPRKYPIDPNIKIQPKQVKPKRKDLFQEEEQQSQNLQMGNIKHQIKFQPGYRRKRSGPPPLSYYEIDLTKLLPIFQENPQIFDSKIPPDIDFTIQSDKQNNQTDDEDQDKNFLKFSDLSLSERKSDQRDMAIVFSTLGFGIAIAKQYFGPSITFTQYNSLLKNIILNSFRKLEYMLFAQKVRIRRLSNSYFILIKSYLTDFKNSLGLQRSDTFKKVIRIAYKFSSTQKYPIKDQLISLYEQIYRLARQRITNADNPVRRKIVERADFWTDEFQIQACRIYLSCRHQWKNLTLIRSQLLLNHPELNQNSLNQLLIRMKFRQLFRRLIGQVVKSRYKLSQDHPDLIESHEVPKVRKIDDNKIRILIHGVSGQQARIAMLQFYLDTQNKIESLIEAVVQLNKVRISGAKYDEMTQQDQIQFQQYMPKRGRKRKALYTQVKRQYGVDDLQSDQLNNQQDNDRI